MGYVRLYSGKDLKEQLALGESRVTIGRTEDNNLVLADPSVSKQHAAIEYDSGEYFIVDLGSSNGVFLNNKRIEREKLKYWDEIQIHNFIIKFMAKPGFGVTTQNENETPTDIEEDKTKFFHLEDEKQLVSLRQKTKRCFVMYEDASGAVKKLPIQKPRTVIGKSKHADIMLSGWFVPSIAAVIERQGGSYELVAGKRGKVTLQGQQISEPSILTDGSKFSVRNMQFEFYNRLTKTR